LGSIRAAGLAGSKAELLEIRELSPIKPRLADLRLSVLSFRNSAPPVPSFTRNLPDAAPDSVGAVGAGGGARGKGRAR
jgi:hypothetical protein